MKAAVLALLYSSASAITLEQLQHIREQVYLSGQSGLTQQDPDYSACTFKKACNAGTTPACAEGAFVVAVACAPTAAKPCAAKGCCNAEGETAAHRGACPGLAQEADYSKCTFKKACNAGTTPACAEGAFVEAAACAPTAAKPCAKKGCCNAEGESAANKGACPALVQDADYSKCTFKKACNAGTTPACAEGAFVVAAACAPTAAKPCAKKGCCNAEGETGEHKGACPALAQAKGNCGQNGDACAPTSAARCGATGCCKTVADGATTYPSGTWSDAQKAAFDACSGLAQVKGNCGQNGDACAPTDAARCGATGCCKTVADGATTYPSGTWSDAQKAAFDSC